mmetsp:Transcript_13522/g.36329  ORF Transcript_13522/g.36329 Transcript_13522/m.36329 type:complete len:146 (-) Transcript_13522:260-697(-)
MGQAGADVAAAMQTQAAPEAVSPPLESSGLQQSSQKKHQTSTVSSVTSYRSRTNLAAVSLMRSYMTIFGGALCGVMGMYGIRGIAFFVALCFAESFMILVRTRFSPRSYFLNPWQAVLVHGAIDREITLSFLLFWTLFYGIVHIF